MPHRFTFGVRDAIRTVDDHITQLQNAISRFNGCDSNYIETLTVTESFEGLHSNVYWQRDVAVFEIYGHPETNRAYVWSDQDTDHQKTRYVVVLQIPPINSAQAALRAAIAALIAKGDPAVAQKGSVR